MKFNLTEIKTAPSRNGLSMTAKFWIDGIYVADFEDKGDGGQPFIYINIYDRKAMELFAQFDAAIDMLPEIYFKEYDHHMKIDQYFFIDMLHAAIVNKQEFKLLEAA
jgi:hypothetical protein